MRSQSDDSAVPNPDPGDGAPPPVRPPGDVVFSAAMHLRLLLRVDRTQSIRRALQAAVRPGGRVLDAGCGSGLLSLLALAAGASDVVAIDRDNIDLARALARENGVEGRIRFIEADLNTLDAQAVPGTFDSLLAFVYTNHPIVDEPRSRTVASLRRRFGSPSCVTVPNRVRYWAVACEWPQFDAFTELADLRHAVADMEHRYSLKFGPLLEAATGEVFFNGTGPRIHGDRKWMPGSTNGGYRHGRDGGRFLSERTAVAEILYDGGGGFEGLPARVGLTVSSPGTVTAVMWGQELWFDEFLLWSSETFSPAAEAVAARAGERLDLILDDRWRATNLVTLAPAELPRQERE
ncbi:class I SAM-dependent methyltransferase [Azospirillum sp. RWY-5-1]|uniref:Class I SAM-dependent methyltransferase n=1 Tax=Azospirillum oleiclasticum TaxID=2735135 RepID=A0ABX2THE2_9PROT|nr:class I SAM-dependent methyltransferase [Azospirillum oleiclasticum]NYZ15560.1 class I SAM-dependent methyltransferase [Azospirillum oleiclasticum]NYZ22583.1 class I SAM-dependent methyltransferase [Azospirillum oleiclasticum]